MLKALYSAGAAILLFGAAAPALAQPQASLDEALAQTLGPTAPHGVRGDKLCRTLTDLGRRNRLAQVCMTSAEWGLLIAVAQTSAARQGGLVRASAPAARYGR